VANWEQIHYNDVRPRRSLQYHAPAEFKLGLPLQIEQRREESREALFSSNH
jgi:hypothetical protein